MRSYDRTELLELLAELSRTYPEWRMGQLIANVAGWADVDVWDIKDDQLMRAARAHLQDLAKRAEPVGATPVSK